MAANTSPIFVNVPNNVGVTFVNADGTTAKTVCTGGTNGTRLVAINVATTDTANNNYIVNYVHSATTYQLGYVSVPLGSGTTSGVPAVNLLATGSIPGLNADGSLWVASGDTVTVAAAAVVTSGKTTYVVGLAGDY